jgi:hypothetical protein
MTRWTCALLVTASCLRPAPSYWTAPPAAARVGPPPAELAPFERARRSTRADTRGFRVAPRPSGRLGFDHTVQLRRSDGALRDLQDGDRVTFGDGLRVSVRTSEDAYLYVAFCSHHELRVLPPTGATRTRAGERLMIPAQGAQFLVDDEPGNEVLYVILSRRELIVADPRPAGAPSRAGEDCTASLDPELVPRDREPAGMVVRGTQVRRELLGLPELAIAPPPDPDFERDPGGTAWYGADDPPKTGIAVTADDDGIAVVRHAFTHVADRSTTGRGPARRAR